MLAIADYTAQYEDELTFNAGDKIQITLESEFKLYLHVQDTCTCVYIIIMCVCGLKHGYNRGRNLAVRDSQSIGCTGYIKSKQSHFYTACLN